MGAGGGKVNRARWGISLRTAAATLGGYALASLSSTAIALVVPMDQRDAVQLGVMVGFLLFGAAAVWAFSVRSALEACLGVAGAIVPFALALVIVGH